MWEHSYVNVCGDSWMRVAIFTKWADTVCKMIDGAYADIGCRLHEQRYTKQSKSAGQAIEMFAKEPRHVSWQAQVWDDFGDLYHSYAFL